MCRPSRSTGPIRVRREEAIGNLLTQRMMDSPQQPRVFGDFRTTE
jgi:hypothetical protein